MNDIVLYFSAIVHEMVRIGSELEKHLLTKTRSRERSKRYVWSHLFDSVSG